MENITDRLRECNLKITPQRMAIFNILLKTDQHLNAEMIYKILLPTYPSTSLATVYKTLDTLKRNGLVNEINLGEECMRYDAIMEPHAHLFCCECKSVFDAPVKFEIDAEKNLLQVNTGFIINNQNISFFGVCKECQGKVC